MRQREVAVEEVGASDAREILVRLAVVDLGEVLGSVSADAASAGSSTIQLFSASSNTIAFWLARR